jgi:hypothetical protein
MYRKTHTPYVILAFKMLKIEDDLFQNNISVFKKPLVALGIVKIDMKKLYKDITSLHKKYNEIKGKDEKKEATEEFGTQLEQAILALEELIRALYKQSKNIESLNWNDYKVLSSKYRLRKEDVLIALDLLKNDVII